MAILQNLRPLLFVTFPQGFQIHKKLGHWTSRTGGKKTVKQSEKSVTDRQINKTKKKKMEISFIIKKTFQKTQKPIRADKSWVTTITFFVSSDKFLYFEKVFLFLQSLFFLTAPHSLSKTSTDMVESKSNMIFHKLTIKQTHFYLVYTFYSF